MTIDAHSSPERSIDTTAESDTANDRSAHLKARRARLEARRHELSLEQQRQLDERLQSPNRADTNASIALTVRYTHDHSLPLSFPQERLWLLEQHDSVATQYHISQIEHIRGKLDLNAFERTIQLLVERHEPLRTRFVIEAERVVQVVEPELPIAVQRLDLQALPIAEREVAAQQLIDVIQAPFALDQTPLIRLGLIQIEEDVHVAFLVLHQMIADGWSIQIFSREFAEVYSALAAGNPVPLTPLDVQYSDYVRWQRERMQGRLLQTQLAYWTARLAGTAPLSHWHTRAHTAAEQPHTGAQTTVTIPEPLHQRLRAQALQEGATLFMVLLAALHVLLAKLNDQHDIVIGTPVAGRTRPEFEGLIGCFINMLALRGDLSADPSFRTVVAQARNTSLEADAHQELPFSILAQTLRPGLPLVDDALFQVVFDMQTSSGGPVQPDQISSNPIRDAATTCHYALIFALRASPLSLEGTLTYRTDLFDAEAATLLSCQFVELLEDLVEYPDIPISAVVLRQRHSASTSEAV